MEKKKNIFVRFFKAIGAGIRTFFCFLVFAIGYFFITLFFRCKVRGKENVKKDDEARVFIANHYELYGPVAMYLRFPFKFRPWIIDKMMTPECIEQQMGLMIYNNYKSVPKWLKKIVISCIKHLMVFVMRFAKGIPVSRENVRENLKTLKVSSETLEKNTGITIFPELDYKTEGVGEFQKGFEHLAKYHYQKTGKKISFYPVFISQVNKEMYIEQPIVFDPDNDPNVEKERIVSLLKQAMVESYKTNEVGSKKYLKNKAKQEKKALKAAKKQESKSTKLNKKQTNDN